MDILEGLLYGLSIAFTVQNLLAAVLGAAIGTLVGVLPGLGPVGAMALLLPVSMGFEPATAIILLAGIYYGSMYGGSTTSILVHIPGEAASIVTMRDGYTMAQQGRAGAALAVAAVGSFVAGTLALFGLVLFTPMLSDLALQFGPPEYFAVALVGLIALSRLSSQTTWKALLMLAVGLAIGSVGTDAVTGTARLTFGSLQASGGLNLVPIVIGLFGFAEVLHVAERRGGLPRIAAVKFRELFGNRQLWRRAAAPILRGSGLGFLIGLIPGPSNVISSFASYNLERRVSKHPEEFGHGAVEGVAGPESANNAATSGQLIPLLGLGIPFSAAAGLLLAALTLQGVQPGPLLLQDHPDVFWGVVASMLVGNVALLVFNLPMVGIWVSMLRLPEGLLISVITVMVLIGAYTLRNSVFDVGVMIVAGVIGYVLRKLDFDLAPLILAIILGPFLETSLRQSLYLSQGDVTIFVTRPLSGALLALLVVGLVVAAALKSRVARMTRGDVDSESRPVEHDRRN